MTTATIPAGGFSGTDSSAGNDASRPAISGEHAIPLIELRDIKRTFVTGGGVEVHALRESLGLLSRPLGNCAPWSVNSR